MSLTLLMKWWKEIALVAVVAGVWLYHNSLKSEIADLKKQTVELASENKTLRDNNETLTQSVNAMNTSIEKLASSAKETNANFTALNGTVKKQTSSLEEKLRGVLAEKRPLTCEETIQYLIDAKKDYK